MFINSVFTNSLFFDKRLRIVRHVVAVVARYERALHGPKWKILFFYKIFY